MTVIVGNLCDGGVVIGTDSAASFGVGTHRTIEQPTDKVYIIRDQLILATTGAMGFGSRFFRVVERNFDGAVFRKMDPLEASKQICKDIIEDFRSTHVTELKNFGALLAFPYKDKPYLVEFEQGTLQPEMKTETLWYVSMGSGQLIADPFLGFMRRVFCPESRPPLLSTGIFITGWTLEHTIDVNPGGIQGPPQIAVLRKTKNERLSAAHLTGDEVEEHKNNVEGAYSYVGEYANILSGKRETPPLPTPPS